ncbi:MAG: DUF6580 family putative transport protein [Lysobacteraceae bacterium]
MFWRSPSAPALRSIDVALPLFFAQAIHATMNQTTNPSPPALGPIVLTVMILLAALSRVLPHPPNFSPIEAVALFGGAYFAQRGVALLVPLVAMMLSDMMLGWLNGGIYLDYFADAHFLSIYACIALSTVLGFGLRGRVSGARVVGYSLVGSVLFFLLTNAAVWMTATNLAENPACYSGLGACYAAGLPFFQWTVAGTLFYSAILFGGFALLRQRVPQLQAQTA